jgi:HSP20 family protein
MLVRYWNPWREIETLGRQIDQVFDELTPSRHKLDFWTPAVELEDAGDNLVLRAQLPGMDAKDLDIQVTHEAVAISGEHRQEEKSDRKGYFRSEFRYGKFRRVVPLPVAIQNTKVQADYKDGILTLTLPKVEAVRNQVVKLNLAQPDAPADSAPEETTNESATN